MYYTFIVNPAARSGLGHLIWQKTESLLKAHNIPYQAHLTCYQRHATRLAREITQDKKEHTLIVLGGDGTLNETVNGIVYPSLTVLGYIPIGSGNDFARFFHLPSDPEQALELILKNHAFAFMDIGNLSFKQRSRRFCVSTGLGFDAAICHQAVISRVKKWMNRLHLGKLTYALIALDRLRFLRPADFTVTCDGQPPRSYQNCLFAVIMNHPYEGGGFQFCPKADPCDGRLDVIIVSGITKWRALLLLPLALKGRHTKCRGISVFSCRTVTVESSLPLPVHTDGEPVYLQSILQAELLTDRLRVIVPEAFHKTEEKEKKIS